MHKQLALRLLGTPEIRLDDQPLTAPVAAKAQALLYYLALTGRAHTRAALAGLLWGDMPEEMARANLRKALADLRPLVDAYLTTDNQMIGLCMEQSLQVDALDFATQVKAQNGQALPRAIDLYGGDLLEGFYVRNAPDFEGWLLTERTHYRQAVLQALHALASQQAEQGDLSAAISTQRRLLALEPWDEEAQRTLMHWLARSGQRSAALAQFDLCRRTLEAELAVEPDGETTALYEQIRAGKIDKETRRPGDKVAENHPATLSPPHLVTRAPRHNLPERLTPLVGRDEELGRIGDLLRNPLCRLLTIVGPGGVGKTSLAIEAARTIANCTIGNAESSTTHHSPPADGIYFVPLASVNAPMYIIPAIAGAIGFTFSGPMDVRTQLFNYLRQQQMVLILDNLEHLLGERSGEGELTAAVDERIELLLDLIEAAPRLKILATSREALNLSGEWLFDLQGLRTPAGNLAEQLPMADHGGVVDGEACSALALFLQIAQRLKPNFVPTTQEQSAIVRICRLVDGLPLGIELAASWVRVLACSEIAAEIEQNFAFLATNQRGVPARHRSMQAVFDYSWQLLAEEEQRALCALTVFRGGFTRTAAATIASAPLPILSLLVSKSLVRRSDEQRYDLHELVRQYALAKLDPAEQLALQQRHATYFLNLVAGHEQALADSRQKVVIAELNLEIDNIRVAWAWANKQQHYTQLCPCAWTLFYFFELRGDFQEGCAFFQRAYTMIQAQPAQSGLAQTALEIAQSNLRIYLGAFIVRLGQSGAALDLLTQAVASLRQHEQPSLLAEALWVYGMIAWNCGKFSAAADSVRESLALSKQWQRPWLITWSTLLLGGVEHELGNYQEAYQLLTQGLRLSRDLGDQRAIAFALSLLSRSAHALGYYGETVTLLHEAQQRAQATNDRYSMSLAAEFLAVAMSALGNRAEAWCLLEEGSRLYREVGDPWGLARIFNIMGNVALAQVNLLAAQGYFLDALRAVAQVNVPVPVLDALAGLATILAQTNAAEDALGLCAVVHQHPAATQAARTRADQIVADLAPRLSPEEMASAGLRLQGKELAAVIAEVLAQQLCVQQ